MQNLPSALVFGLLLQSAASSWAQAEVTAADQPTAIRGSDACEAAKQHAGGELDALSLLYLERCHRSAPTREVRERMMSLRKSVGEAHKASSPVSLALSPSTATARLFGESLPESYKGVLLVDQDEIRLPPGHYEIEIHAPGFDGGRFAIEVESSNRMLVPISLKARAETTTTEIDMGDEAGAELGQVANTPDPRPKKFKTLLAKRYERAPTPEPIPMTESDDSGPGPWPWISAGLGAAAVATGLVLHSQDSIGPAIGSYGAGAVFGGLATYLFLRETGSESAPIGLDIGSSRAIFVWQARWN